jgi:hypothetical protein
MTDRGKRAVQAKSGCAFPLSRGIEAMSEFISYILTKQTLRPGRRLKQVFELLLQAALLRQGPGPTWFLRQEPGPKCLLPGQRVALCKTMVKIMVETITNVSNSKGGCLNTPEKEALLAIILGVDADNVLAQHLAVAPPLAVPLGGRGEVKASASTSTRAAMGSCTKLLSFDVGDDLCDLSKVLQAFNRFFYAFNLSLLAEIRQIQSQSIYDLTYSLAKGILGNALADAFSIYAPLKDAAEKDAAPPEAPATTVMGSSG